MKNKVVSSKEQSARTFNRLANSYDTTYYGKHSGNLHNVVLQKIRIFPHNTILDVGCGTGSLLSKIPQGNDTKLYGIDLSPAMIKVARDKLDRDVELKAGDSEHLPWTDASFDIVCSSDSFHHYPQPEKVLREMKRVLKLNGHIVIGDLWYPSPLRQIANLLCRFSNTGDVGLYSNREMVGMLSVLGFTKINWQRISFSSFVVTAKSETSA
ncbi:MAG TPA: class I SAM-dependent methyltransferase [Spirochaetia bacterium]|nr:class I SAM-dependent methyltransferase [Spirochaetia bacterium]